MTFRYRNKNKSTKKKTYKKTLGRRNAPQKNGPSNQVNMGLAYPKQSLVRHKYQDRYIMSSAGGALTHYGYSLNGMWDPKNAVGGNQPLYFDQLMAVYNHYTVIGAKMKVTVVPFDTNTVPCQIALWQNDDTTVTPSSFHVCSEQSKSQNRLLAEKNVKPTTLYLNWSAKKTFGGSVLSNVDLRGNAVSNPVDQSYGQISLQTVDSVTTSVVALIIDIEYSAIYTELRDMYGS